MRPNNSMCVSELTLKIPHLWCFVRHFRRWSNASRTIVDLDGILYHRCGVGFYDSLRLLNFFLDGGLNAAAGHPPRICDDAAIKSATSQPALSRRARIRWNILWLLRSLLANTPDMCDEFKENGFFLACVTPHGHARGVIVPMKNPNYVSPPILVRKMVWYAHGDNSAAAVFSFKFPGI